jgi:hypothetical protein
MFSIEKISQIRMIFKGTEEINKCLKRNEKKSPAAWMIKTWRMCPSLSYIGVCASFSAPHVPVRVVNCGCLDDVPPAGRHRVAPTDARWALAS